ncbi:MAG: cysteine hydrolase [Candidatus Bathyarchaeota archaeon]|nr:cysteine hydrolase [Candidatus Bathyarchaeota archaeon]
MMKQMTNAALLIMDMQVGNFSEPNPIYKGNELLKKAKNLISKARSSIPIVFIQNNGGSGDPDEYGTAGWRIHPSIEPMQDDVVIQKRTPDAFHKTNLNDELKSRGIKKLVVVGLQTEYCIDTTCRSAFNLGYEVILVKDSHSTWDSSILTAEQIIEHHNNVLSGFFVVLKNESEVIF